MLTVIVKLLKPKILGVKNQWQRASWKEQLIFAFFIVMGVLFWLGLSGLFWFAIKTLYGIEIVGPWHCTAEAKLEGAGEPGGFCRVVACVSNAFCHGSKCQTSS